MTEKRIEKIKVGSIMTQNVVTIDTDASIEEVHDLFVKYDYNAIPVVHEGAMKGIITKLDLMKIFSTGTEFRISGYFQAFSEKASEIMHTATVTVGPEDDLGTVVDYMVEFKLRSIPVMEGETLVGIVSRGDVIKHLIVEDGK